MIKYHVREDTLQMHTYMTTVAQTHSAFIKKDVAWLSVLSSALHAAKSLIFCYCFDFIPINYERTKSFSKQALVRSINFKISTCFLEV